MDQEIRLARRQLAKRIKDSGVEHEEFIEDFLDRHEELVREFHKEASNERHYFDDWLESVIETATQDYAAYGKNYSEIAHVPRTESGEIRPSRPRRDKRSIHKADPWERQEALGRYLARFAADHPDVRRFRNQLLGGKTLTAQEARELISSPYAASRSLSSAKRHGRNALRSPLSVQEGEDKDGWPYRSVLVRGTTKAFSVNIWPLVSTVSKGLIFPGDVVEPWDVRTQRWLPDRNPGQRVFLFPHPEEEDRYVAATEKSVLAELAGLSERRLRGYPISPEKGSWFILTDEFIPINPIRISYLNLKHPNFKRSTLTIEAESWMSPEEVAEHYRYAQREILGKTPRSLDAKALDVFDFVNRSKERTWEERLRAWNKMNPAHRFSQRAHLYQAYNRALRKIASAEDQS